MSYLSLRGEGWAFYYSCYLSLLVMRYSKLLSEMENWLNKAFGQKVIKDCRMNAYWAEWNMQGLVLLIHLETPGEISLLMTLLVCKVNYGDPSRFSTTLTSPLLWWFQFLCCIMLTPLYYLMFSAVPLLFGTSLIHQMTHLNSSPLLNSSHPMPSSFLLWEKEA